MHTGRTWPTSTTRYRLVRGRDVSRAQFAVISQVDWLRLRSSLELVRLTDAVISALLSY
ncbi:hypothetical protein CY34DRAFT_803220 [Suillus luteus UH-Slu-Lm8-n1]|uniref:Uncharacterized protein n=1 Tax=Suillus luteus UH-Slu-Lm8-n1 TaxID=930992 RepID=A0A0D0BL64_9AGAM|nr:hypothetical protein CY34DRAFT_803220 [Suillus luteus UH-Slu-Lm8-n1]